MVQAYRDTWELGLHSYLTYLRDRLLVARDLLAPSGSVFVQISDENVHHVREVLDEVFGSENFVAQIMFLKTGGFETNSIADARYFLLWYAKDREPGPKYREDIRRKSLGTDDVGPYSWLELADGTRRRMTSAERQDPASDPPKARRYRLDNLRARS